MGGEQRVLAQHAKGRLCARERLSILLDSDSFAEIGAFVGSIQRGALPVAPADAFVMGHGTINGRVVLVGAEDATVMGGTIGIGTFAKRLRLFELAARTSVPLILLLDGAGMRTRHPNDRSLFVPDDLSALAGVKGSSPIIVGVMGTCAGRGALTATFADYVVMVNGAALFAAGPPVVNAVSGMDVGVGELGGVQVHSREARSAQTSSNPDSDTSLDYEGIVDVVASNDHEALGEIRRHFLGLLQEENPKRAPLVETVRSGNVQLVSDRKKLNEVDIREIIPSDLTTPWNVLDLLEAISDDGSLEILAEGGSVVTARLTFFDSKLVVIANQPNRFDGRLDSEGALAAANALVSAADADTPVLLLADSPGLAVGLEAEVSGILSAAQVLLSEQRRFTGSTIHVTLRRAYGDISPLMGLAPFGGQICTLALVGARIGDLPAETASDAVRNAVRNTGSSDAVLAQTEFGGAVDGAEQLLYDNILAPNELIHAIRSALRLL